MATALRNGPDSGAGRLVSGDVRFSISVGSRDGVARIVRKSEARRAG